MPFTTYGPGDAITFSGNDDPQDEAPSYCEECDSELDQDCWGYDYCPGCDGPCDGCRDY